MREKWTQTELDQLVKYYYVMGAREIGKRIGRTTAAVYRQAFDSGLFKNDGRGRPKAPAPVQETKWARSYLEIHEKACELHDSACR